MSKRIKPDLPVVQYNLTLRTAQKFYWMKHPDIKQMFLDLLYFFTQVYFVEVFSVNLMDNHWHLVIEVRKPDYQIDEIERRHQIAQTRLVHPRPFYEEQGPHFYKRYTDLSKFMWDFNRGTAVAHNKLKGTSGHLWGGRFHSEVIEDGHHLLNAVAYTEMNAVRAGLVETPEEQEYCTSGQIKRALDAGEKPTLAPIGFLATVTEEDRPLAFLEWTRDVAKRYHDPDYRNQPSPPELTRYLGKVDQKAIMDSMEERKQRKYSRPIYGSPEFIKKITQASKRTVQKRGTLGLPTPRGRGDPVMLE